MSATPYNALLEEIHIELTASVRHLNYSCQSVDSISHDQKWTESDLEKIEALTSRFARVVDLLVQRVFRGIDRFELLEPGTLLDAANRAEARELIPSVDWLRQLKDTRNKIAHDYAGTELKNLFSICRQEMSDLLACAEKVDVYISGLLMANEGGGVRAVGSGGRIRP